MRRKLLGPEHSDVAGSMTLLAGLLVETGRYEEALKLARDAKAILLKALAPGLLAYGERRRRSKGRRSPGCGDTTKQRSCC